MATTEYLPWASGKRKAPAGRKRSTRRRRKHQTLLSVALGITAALFLASGLIAESLLYYLVAATFALATVAQRRAMTMEMRMADRSRGQVIPPKKAQKARPGPPTADRAKKMREEAAAARTAGAQDKTPTGPVKCTSSGKPVDDCDCASRHVATDDGARRYGLPVGSPLGRKKG